jgi:hypothetical protein
MGKILGNDVVTTAEFQAFEEDVMQDLQVRVNVASATASNLKWGFIIGGIVTLINLGLVVYVLIR